MTVEEIFLLNLHKLFSMKLNQTLLLILALVYKFSFSQIVSDEYLSSSINGLKSNLSYNLSIHKTRNEINQTVYVCNGPYAYAYHSISNCPGLQNCSGQIQYTDENYALYTMQRVPCCRCWSNTNGRCKDDNPYNRTSSGGGGGGDGEELLMIGLAIVAFSAILLSNDIYISGVTELRKLPEQYKTMDNSEFSVGYGFNSFLRKTFKKSALEYGGGLITFNEKYTYKYHTGIIDSISNQSSVNYVTVIKKHYFPSIQISYLHYFPMPKINRNNVKVFIGPTINANYQFCYGISSGVQWGIFDRLKFDFRYELTNFTNRFSAGLIFTYQKKYLWQK